MDSDVPRGMRGHRNAGRIAFNLDDEGVEILDKAKALFGVEDDGLPKLIWAIFVEAFEARAARHQGQQ